MKMDVKKIKLIAFDLDGTLLPMDTDAFMKLYFENEGYKVKTANDGAEGVSCFKMFEPDLVLLDIMMPKIDGYQVLQELRKESNIPVVILSAKATA